MKFEYFSEQQLKEVHEASVQLLIRTGIGTTSDGFKALLSDNGCRVENDRVFFTREIIETALGQAPSKFSIYGRTDEHKLEMGSGKAYAQTCVGTPSIMDLDSGEKRDCMLKDLENYARLADALEFIDLVSPVFPRDVSQDVIVMTETATMLRNTTKPLRICAESSHELEGILGMLSAVAGGRDKLQEKPIAYIEVSPMSPLDYGIEPANALMDIVEAGVPLGIIPCPMMGSTGPMTIAGCVAMHNAEILAGVVASQLIKPGAPVIMSPRPTFMDMRSGMGLWAMPEMGMMAAGAVQLARHYNIPSTATGYSCAANTSDMQSGYEHLYNALLPALIGTDILAAAGSLDNCLTSCYAMLVMDNELSSVIKRSIEPVDVSEETLAVDVVDEVVKKKSHFLGHKHTRAHLRAGGLWAPPIGDRQPFEKWAVKGQKIEDKAREIARELLASHGVTPLEQGVSDALEQIIQDYKTRN